MYHERLQLHTWETQRMSQQCDTAFSHDLQWLPLLYAAGINSFSVILRTPSLHHPQLCCCHEREQKGEKTDETDSRWNTPKKTITEPRHPQSPVSPNPKPFLLTFAFLNLHIFLTSIYIKYIKYLINTRDSLGGNHLHYGRKKT